ncbi:MAG: PQQ-binding-like beta-propeller repeat protein [Planctomycetes bacterium]|nr:PQQ-binding-like beta-propeller repeat protein [Planctomycetota bacterium]
MIARLADSSPIAFTPVLPSAALLALLLLSAAATPRTASPQTPGCAIPPAPVVVENRWVSPDEGVVLGKIPGANPYRWAVPDPDHRGRYRIGEVVFDVATCSVVAREPEEVRFEDDAVVRQDPAGKTAWSVRLGDRLGGVRPPDRLADGERVFVVVGEGIVALDRPTGRELWRAEGPADRLCASRDLLLATSCASSVRPEDGRWLVARSTETGKPAWRARLPDVSDPMSIREVGGLFLVRDGGFGGKGAYARFFDRMGALRIDLTEHVAAAWPQEDGFIVVTERRIARLDPHGSALWESDAAKADDSDGAEVVPLPGGDLLVYTWCRLADSGVAVARVRATDGKAAWRSICAALGVPHSKYWHRPYVQVRGDQAIVVSQGAGGDFIEILALDSGKQLSRRVVPRP